MSHGHAGSVGFVMNKASIAQMIILERRALEPLFKTRTTCQYVLTFHENLNGAKQCTNGSVKLKRQLLYLGNLFIILNTMT